jgi:hypothetical protein
MAASVLEDLSHSLTQMIKEGKDTVSEFLRYSLKPHSKRKFVRKEGRQSIRKAQKQTSEVNCSKWWKTELKEGFPNATVAVKKQFNLN